MNINEKKSFDVIVIGGGAAGMMAAITAASNGADTMILEHKDRVGKKILSTGNGKCNYTNELQGVTFYRGDDPAFVLPVMEQFGFEETVSFLKTLGYIQKQEWLLLSGERAGGICIRCAPDGIDIPPCLCGNRV
mgnify:CR=1 FL=1